MEIMVEWWHWLVLGMALSLLEIFLPSFVFLIFGMSAGIVGLALYLFPSLALSAQVFIWTIAICCNAAVWFKVIKPRLTDRTMAGLSKEMISNKTGIVLEAPNEQSQHGRLRFNVPILGNDEWEFLCETPEVQAGDRVRVIDVLGNTLIVVKA
jgi:hypothetical protein